MSEAMIIVIEPEENEEERNKQFLQLCSWVCGVCFVVLFSGSVATQAITNYIN